MPANIKHRRNDIRATVKEYMDQRNPGSRYASFDYCFNHFSPCKRYSVDLEKSCLALGFYLASWGMFRGKSFMLQKSVKHLLPAVEYIHSLEPSYWNIDVHKYTSDNRDQLLTLYQTLKSKINCEESAHLTLVTKIMLGVFGNVPAYDRYFCETFRQVFKGECAFRVFSKESLLCLNEFYLANEKTLSSLSEGTYTIDFISGKETKKHYTLAKVIDMYGFYKRQQMNIADYKDSVQDALSTLREVENVVFSALVNVGFAGEYSDISQLHEEGEVLNLELAMFEETDDQNLTILTELVKEIVKAKERIIDLNGLSIDTRE